MVSSLPGKNAVAPKDLEVRPKAVKAAIERSPLSQGLDGCRRLIAHVTQLNGVRVDVDDRVEILEIYRPHAMGLIDEMEALYARSTVPLPPRAAEALAAATQLASAMSTGYEIALQEKAGKRLAFGVRKQMPPVALQAMKFLGAAFHGCLRSYTPVPPGQWRRLHALYLLAEGHGIERQPGDAQTNESVHDAYCEVLLVAIADPYRLPQGSAERILAQVRGARGLATVERAKPATSASAHFVVPCDDDLPPKPALSAHDEIGGPNVRWLDANALVQRLRTRKYAAESGQLSAALRSAMGPDVLALMGDLITLWGDPPRRSQRREPCEGTAAICVGIPAVGHFVSLEPHLEPDDERVRLRDGITMPLQALAVDDEGRPIPVFEWDVADRSEGGLRVRRVAPSPQTLRVGDAIGVKLGDRPRWSVGVVRWLTGLPAGGMEFGLQFLAPDARFAWLQSTANPEAQARPCLLIASEEARDLVLAPSGTYADLREYELDSGGAVSRVRALQLIEKTPRFDLFRTAPS